MLRLKFALPEDFGLESGSDEAPLFDPSNASSINSSRLEFDIVQGLLDNVEQLLNGYPTTIDEDVALLQHTCDGTLDNFGGASQVTPIAKFKYQSALGLRLEIKRILHATILECLKQLANHFAETTSQPDASSESNPIQSSLWTHWQDGLQFWRSQWSQWKRDIELTWDTLTCHGPS